MSVGEKHTWTHHLATGASARSAALAGTVTGAGTHGGICAASLASDDAITACLTNTILMNLVNIAVTGDEGVTFHPEDD